MAEEVLTPAQVRAARSLLQWSQSDLAERAGVAVSTVADFERGHRAPIANNALAIRRTLESAWLVFTDGGVVPGIRWTFMTERTRSALNATFQPETSTVILEFASLFAEVTESQIALNMIQCASPKLKAELTEFVDRHAGMAPHLHRLKKMVCDLADGSFFLLLTTPPSSTQEQLRFEQLLHRLNHPDEATYESEQERIFGKLLQEYDTTMPRTDKRTEIGNPRKLDRRCRFCNLTVAKGAKFEKEAHAIPAALGNQFLKLNDECDVCNKYFGDNIEPTLIDLLNIQRVFLGIESRGSRPNIMFPGGEMFHDGKKVVVASSKISTDAAGALSVQLGGERCVVAMKFYQALAKIALSVIPEEELPSLNKTVEWVRFDKFAGTRLPNIASTVLPFPPNPSAQITLYVRRQAISRLPHVVCEFRLGCYIYVYALPFSAKDNWDLIGFFGDTTFKETFQHYSHVGSWSLSDYSSADEKSIVHTIKLVPNTPEERQE